MERSDAANLNSSITEQPALLFLKPFQSVNMANRKLDASLSRARMN